jgi:hypothetical protein
MKKLLIAAALLCAATFTASASIVTATASDTDGQTWNNCTFSATLTIPGSGFGPAPSVGGVPVTPLTVKGTCSASGVLTAILTDTSTVDQAGAKWVFKVCPNASVLPITVTTTVIGSSPSLTPAFSQLSPPRFAAGEWSFGYSDIEVMNPLVGVSYFNTGALPGYRKYSLAGWTGGGGGGGSLASLGLVAGVAGPDYFFGDSTVAPNGSGDSGTSLQMANRLSNDLLGQKFPYAVAATITPSISAAVYANFPVNFNTSSNLPKVYIEAGINDANQQTATTGVLNNYSLTYNAMISWMAMPVNNRVYATVATSAGTWTATNFTNLHASNTVFGGFRQSITNGSTLTFTTPASGTRIGINYGANVTNGGTFTFAIDGVLQTSVCSGTTTFVNTGCNASTLNGLSLFREDFPVTAGTHTGVVTVTSTTSASNIVYIAAVDVTPTTLVGQPTILASGIIEQAANANAANTLAFDQAQAAVMASSGTWANAYRVDVRGGMPGVNSAADMAANNTGCTGGVTPLHPNSCGYQHWVQTVENTAAANGLSIFFPGLGVNPSFINTPLQVQGAVTAGVALPGIGDALGSFQVSTQSAATSLALATPNIFNNAVPTATLFAQPAGFLPPTVAISAANISFDVVNARLATGFISEYEMGFQHCPHNVTGGPTSCRWDLYTDPTTGIATAPLGFSSPSIKATTGTRFVCVDTVGNITSSASACSGT